MSPVDFGSAFRYDMFRRVKMLRYLPLFTFGWLLVTFLVSYSLAAGLKHVYPVWPYISDTGTLPPESCIFGQMLNIGALLMGAIFYCRYRQVKIHLAGSGGVPRLANLACLLAGCAAAFGASMVANFQETSNLTFHLIGANLIFGVGCGYFVIHTALSYAMCRDPFSRRLNAARGLLCCVHVASFAATLIFARMSLRNFPGGVSRAMHFNPDDPDYVYRLASTFSEWLLAVCLGLYLVSFSHEFKHLDYKLTFTLDDADRLHSYATDGSSSAMP